MRIRVRVVLVGHALEVEHIAVGEIAHQGDETEQEEGLVNERCASIAL